ncbi:hypothetical protein HDU86_006626 [Geranomyces michiganensis]|nr:hypothetical protein HDU86_006626 [Geranomyces michiganensis]
MRSPRSILLWIAFALACIAPLFLGVSAARRDDQPRVDSKTGLIFTHEFPSNPFNVITAGESNEIRINIDNQGELTQTVFSVSGFLSHPTNHTTPKRNLTATAFKRAIKPNDKTTVVYRFDFESDPGEHGLVIYVDVTDEEGNSRRAVGYRGIVKVTESSSMFDLQSISIYILLIAGAGAIAYYTYDSFLGSGSSKSGRRSVKRAGSSSSAISAADAAAAPVGEPGKPNMEWIPAHLVEQQTASLKRQSSRLKNKAANAKAAVSK